MSDPTTLYSMPCGKYETCELVERLKDEYTHVLFYDMEYEES